MSAPMRVQLSRARGWRKPANTVVVSRPSRWANPWPVRKTGAGWIVGFGSVTDPADPWYGDQARTHQTRADAHAYAVDLYRQYIARRQDLHVSDLRGKSLACWCPLDLPCHADVLLQLAGAEVPS